jgi:hypothetical protein
MFLAPRFFIFQVAAYAASFVIQAMCGLSAQNFTARSSGLNPFGVNGPLPFGKVSDFGGGQELGQGFKGGFLYGVGLSSTYDSNILLSENNPESDVSLSFLPTIGYTTDPEGGAPMVITANYLPSANAYLNNTDFNSFDQSGNIAMVFTGSRTTISAFAGIAQDSGADSLAASQGFFTGTAVSLGLQAGYQVGPRTSVNAGISSSIADYGDGTTGSSAVGFSDYSVNLGGFWAATERLSFGPNLSYGLTSSDSVENFNTWGLSIQGNYKATERIRVAGSIGFDYSEFSQEGASNDVFPSGSLNANYKIDERWSWSGSIQSGLSPSPTGSNSLINGWTISSTLDRTLRFGTVGFGVIMDFSNYQSIGPTGVFPTNQTSQTNQQNIEFSLNYSRPLPLFNDRLGFNSSFIYVANYGDFEYSQILVNAGLNMAF